MTLSLMPLHHLITGPPPDAAWNFTLDEIRQQLAYLNVTNLSDSHICQLKKQLDDLIAKELEHVQVASELSCCRIEDPVSSHLDSVSKFSSDSGDCTTPESEMHKSLSDLDSHHTVPTFAPQSNYSNRKGQSTKLFSKPHAWVRPCRSARTGYLSHVLQPDMRTESRDTVSSISEISDSSAVGLPAEQGADDASSAHPRSLFRDRYLEYPSLFPGTVDSQYKRHRDTPRRPHTDCTRITASSTLVPQITRVMQWDCSPTATPATVAPKVNSRPLSTCDLLRPSNQRQLGQNCTQANI
ncbi:unnamed protein product [Dicrocoelium dendriticum]|nr:unnamed protein product [Dicrocoelium dendriticum]